MADISDKGVRHLPYPLIKPLSTSQDTPDEIVEFETVDVFPIDPDEKISIKLELSLNEYVALSSAIDVGRDIAYSEDTTLIWWLWARVFKGLVETMDCLDVADCIETNAETIAAVQQLMNNYGVTPNLANTPNHATETLSTAQGSSNLLAAAGVDCASHTQNMAIARAIVRELHESVQDAFETFEYMTNAAEAAGQALGFVPAAGTGEKLIEFVDWMLETVIETYSSAYNQSAEDTIACKIYCHIEDTCEISLDSLLSIYEELATVTVPTLETFDDLLEFMLTTTMNADVTGVALFHYFLLRGLKFGGAMFDLSGFNDLANVIETAATYEDFSYDICDDCPPTETPTTYWKMYLDFRISKWGTVPVVWNGAPNDGAWSGAGWIYNPVAVSTTNVAFGLPDLGAAFVIKAAATQSVRRGGDGSGTNDLAVVVGYPNANFGGAANAGLGGAFVTPNTNDVRWGGIYPANVTAYRSFAFRSRVQEAANLATAMLRVYSVVLWGVPNAGNVKPQGSVWAGNTLPSTVENLFP